MIEIYRSLDHLFHNYPRIVLIIIYLVSQNPWKTPGMGSLAAAWLRMTGGREEQQGQMGHKTPIFGVFLGGECP